MSIPFMELLYEGICPDCGSCEWWMGPEGGMTNMYRSPCGLWASVSPFGIVFNDRQRNRWFNRDKIAPLGGDYGMSIEVMGEKISIGDLAIWGGPPRDVIVTVTGFGKHKFQIEDANNTSYIIDYDELRPYLEDLEEVK